MTLIAAENRELALSISINQRNPKPRIQKTRGTGYYLALTFGTLLSSQGADAQKLDPRGPRPWQDVQLYAGFQLLPIPGGWSGGPSGPRGAWRTIHDPEGSLHGGRSGWATAQLRGPGKSRSPP